MSVTALTQAGRELKELASATSGEDFPMLHKLYAYSEYYVALFESEGSEGVAFDVVKAISIFEANITAHISRLRAWVQGPMAECASFAAFAADSRNILGNITWECAIPALKWILHAVELMNELMQYEDESVTGGSGRFFASFDATDKIRTNALSQILWLISLAEIWNTECDSLIGKVSIHVFASLDHVWFGFEDPSEGWVPCELCCTASSNNLVLACIGRDPSMLFRNTVLSESLEADRRGAVSAVSTVCCKGLSQRDFAAFVLSNAIHSMKDRLEREFSSNQIDAVESPGVCHMGVLLLDVLDVLFLLSAQSSSMDPGLNFVVGCLFLVAENSDSSNQSALQFRRLLIERVSGAIGLQVSPHSAVEALDRAVQFNSEHYLARRYLIEAFRAVDPYLAYKHCCFLLDLVGVYNENGLSAKCQSAYEFAVEEHRELQEANHFNESAESEYLADIPEIGKMIMVTWDVEFEDDPTNVQPFEYDAILCVKTDLAVEGLVGDQGVDPRGHLYVTYLSTGEKYYVRFKSHESCEHLMEDGKWEAFSYYISCEDGGCSENGSGDGDSCSDGAEAPGRVSAAVRSEAERSAPGAGSGAGDVDEDVSAIASGGLSARSCKRGIAELDASGQSEGRDSSGADELTDVSQQRTPTVADEKDNETIMIINSSNCWSSGNNNNSSASSTKKSRIDDAVDAVKNGP